MKILVACEESQAVTKELRRLGHEAYSCDIIPYSKARSKTFPGIADAMAQQWGAVLGGDTDEP